jgi:hypothetical protein
LTDPEQAADFVKRTGDCSAIANGTSRWRMATYPSQAHHISWPMTAFEITILAVNTHLVMAVVQCLWWTRPGHQTSIVAVMEGNHGVPVEGPRKVIQFYARSTHHTDIVYGPCAFWLRTDR